MQWLWHCRPSCGVQPSLALAFGITPSRALTLRAVKSRSCLILRALEGGSAKFGFEMMRP